MNNPIKTFTTLLTLLVSGSIALAQSATATISGTITDTQNAHIAGAIVKGLNPATNFSRNVATNSEGFFSLPLLPPGAYTVSVEQAV